MQPLDWMFFGYIVEQLLQFHVVELLLLRSARNAVEIITTTNVQIPGREGGDIGL